MRNPFKIRLSGLLSIVCAFFLLYGLSVQASDIENSQTINSGVQAVSWQTTTTAQRRDSRLTEAEWAQYQQWMQGSDALWYPQLSPAAVLGLHAQTETERQHFAELVAEEQHDKIAREITFNHAVYLAMLRLYPEEPIIKPFNQTPFNPQQHRGHSR